MQQTTNYKFKKPELTDSPPDITVLNENFDIIDEKIFAVIQTWEDFKANGGEIGGRVTAKSLYSEGGKIYKTDAIGSNGAYVIETENGKQLVFNIPSADGTKFNQIKIACNDDGGRYIVPSITNSIQLGSSDFTFRDLWLGGFSKSANGYTKLPNGLILQWGVLKDHVDGVIMLPIAFPNAILHLSGSINNSPDNWGGNLYLQRIAGTSSFRAVVVNKPGLTYSVNWIAIGY